MDYSYNYGYLYQFMESHHLQKKDILEALGCCDYVSLNKWLDGKVPVHITAMLRFCNYYNVAMENFFCDADGMPVSITPTLPDDSTQTEPTDGYGIKEGRGRGIVETHVSQRSVSSPAQAKAVTEGLARQGDQQHRRDVALMENRETTQNDTKTSTEDHLADADRMVAQAKEQAEQRMTETMLRMQLDHQTELRNVERESREREDRVRRDCQANFDAERNRLMDIIERQSHELSKCYHHGYMVAEDQHTGKVCEDHTEDDADPETAD